jgi:hypothetical protein
MVPLTFLLTGKLDGEHILIYCDDTVKSCREEESDEGREEREQTCGKRGEEKEKG